MTAPAPSPGGNAAGRIAFVDAPAGCAGDMFLGALVDAGLPLAVLEGVVTGLGLAGVAVRAKKVTRGPLAATKVDVLVDGEVAEVPADHERHAHTTPHEHGPGHGHGHDHAPEHGHEHAHGGHAHSATAPMAVAHGAPAAHAHSHRHGHRTLPEVLEILSRARGIAPEALADARRTFRALAEAEGRVHGVLPEAVRFHEVGALDALVDVTGTCAGLHALGVTEVRVGALPWPAGGSVRSAHGDLPLPVPAVAHLLVGHPTFPGGERFEQVTPTGAALVRALARGTAVPSGFVPRAVGLGAGTRDAGRLPNVLRLIVGDVTDDGTATDAVLLETNLDDATGQTVARAVERALEEGALDAWTVPATMKKGRPGLVVSVLARPEDVARLETVLFTETPTLGVRRRAVARTVLAREHVTVETPWGPVRMKVRAGPTGREGTPEHDDCRRIADAHGLPLRDVLEAAQRAWAR